MFVHRFDSPKLRHETPKGSCFGFLWFLHLVVVDTDHMFPLRAFSSTTATTSASAHQACTSSSAQFSVVTLALVSVIRMAMCKNESKIISCNMERKTSPAI